MKKRPTYYHRKRSPLYREWYSEENCAGLALIIGAVAGVVLTLI